jgi:hypothetical protein
MKTTVFVLCVLVLSASLLFFGYDLVKVSQQQASTVKLQLEAYQNRDQLTADVSSFSSQGYTDYHVTCMYKGKTKTYTDTLSHQGDIGNSDYNNLQWVKTNICQQQFISTSTIL